MPIEVINVSPVGVMRTTNITVPTGNTNMDITNMSAILLRGGVTFQSNSGGDRLVSPDDGFYRVYISMQVDHNPAQTTEDYRYSAYVEVNNSNTVYSGNFLTGQDEYSNFAVFNSRILELDANDFVHARINVTTGSGTDIELIECGMEKVG